MVVASASAETGDVVLTSDTGSTVTLADGWEQLDDGEITDVEPAKGHFGTEVTISGTNLLGGADDLASITLAGETASYTAGSLPRPRLPLLRRKAQTQAPQAMWS